MRWRSDDNRIRSAQRREKHVFIYCCAICHREVHFSATAVFVLVRPGARWRNAVKSYHGRQHQRGVPTTHLRMPLVSISIVGNLVDHVTVYRRPFTIPRAMRRARIGTAWQSRKWRSDGSLVCVVGRRSGGRSSATGTAKTALHGRGDKPAGGGGLPAHREGQQGAGQGEMHRGCFAGCEA